MLSHILFLARLAYPEILLHFLVDFVHSSILPAKKIPGNTALFLQNQKKQEETILSDSSGNSAPYVIKELEPEISGIVISCEGAGNKVVEASVLEAVQVLFGVSANHIKVLKMEVSK